ncbi:GntR family transcriptional regulator [Aerococcus urinaehominis]|uniref:GntR family transcriptional regulator n=1 Tax=Aerococcus urinaehominis TaxID=128944 RepID=A0A0X8FME7_9LACT|nr:GntR family transcriptional regulator [Aerococcus urinaehominis]AMB99989.1 GntR family transcriptional regulator [Aerococcus urinaehominis]SDL82814.1 DNA-binding transcriptional regulator YhcF, GntR family [Aerococcus urinaehominis]
MEIPIFIQISQFVEDEIMKGALKAHDKVPSTNEFAKTMSVNPATAGKGLNALVDKGVLYKKRGLGMFVTDAAYDLVQADRRQIFKEKTVPQFIRDSQHLNLSLEELLAIIKEAYHAGNH